jgi:hypothetical protein
MNSLVTLEKQHDGRYKHSITIVTPFSWLLPPDLYKFATISSIKLVIVTQMG